MHLEKYLLQNVLRPTFTFGNPMVHAGSTQALFGADLGFSRAQCQLNWFYVVLTFLFCFQSSFRFVFVFRNHFFPHPPTSRKHTHIFSSQFECWNRIFRAFFLQGCNIGNGLDFIGHRAGPMWGQFGIYLELIVLSFRVDLESQCNIDWSSILTSMQTPCRVPLDSDEVHSQLYGCPKQFLDAPTNF